MKLREYVEKNIENIDPEFVLEAAETHKKSTSVITILRKRDLIRNISTSVACIAFSVVIIIAFVMMRNSAEYHDPDTTPPADSDNLTRIDLTDRATETPTDTQTEKDTETETETEPETDSVTTATPPTVDELYDSKDFWLDRKQVANANLQVVKAWDDYLNVAYAFVSSVHPELGEIVDNKGNRTTLFICTDNESYDSNGYDFCINCDFWTLTFEDSSTHTVILYAMETMKNDDGTYSNDNTLIGVEDCTDGVIYNRDHLLEYLKEDPRFSNAVSAKRDENQLSHSDGIIALNMSMIPELKEIITQYPSLKGYQHTITLFKSNDIESVPGHLTITTSEYKNIVYSFNIGLLSGKVSDVKLFESTSKTQTDSGTTSSDSDTVHYDSDKIRIYTDIKADTYAENKLTGKKLLIYEGLTQEEQEAAASENLIDGDDWDLSYFKNFSYVTFYNDRYVVYNIVGWEWVCGFGIFDTETGYNYYNDDLMILAVRNEKLFVDKSYQNYPDSHPGMQFILLSEYQNGKCVLHDIPHISELTDVWEKLTISEDGKIITVLLYIYNETERIYEIKMINTESGNINEQFISGNIDYNFNIGDYYIFTDSKSNYLSNNFDLDFHAYIIENKD